MIISGIKTNFNLSPSLFHTSHQTTIFFSAPTLLKHLIIVTIMRTFKAPHLKFSPTGLHNGYLQCTMIITRYTNGRDTRDKYNLIMHANTHTHTHTHTQTHKHTTQTHTHTQTLKHTPHPHSRSVTTPPPSIIRMKGGVGWGEFHTKITSTRILTPREITVHSITTTTSLTITMHNNMFWSLFSIPRALNAGTCTSCL